MTSLAYSVLGAAAGLVLWRAMRPTLEDPIFARTNYRGHRLPTGAGIVVVLAALAVEGAATLAETGPLGTDPGVVAARRVVVLAALGFGLLGLLDDLTGVGESGGFRGHLRALGQGRLTTGGVKLFGGAALALAVMGTIEPGATGRLVADAALVALAANLANLLDRAPGRVTKAGVVAAVALAAASGLPDELAGVALVVGAVVSLVVVDLREQAMLGDSGANVIGAVLGVGVVLATSPATRTAVLVVVAALNLASEAVSFSRVIDRVPPLRWADGLGRRHPR